MQYANGCDDAFSTRLWSELQQYLAVKISILIKPDLLKSISLLSFLDPQQFDVVQAAGHRHHEARLSVP